MPIPRSVLKECTESFLAVDENRTKASTTFFNDTGVMVLLCRHDRVLWVANMKTTGEKQFYAIALLQTLFQHLPTTATIGVLYDIACKLQESCIKWGFLAECLNRISWAISIFHAYGHQWACQLVYHPCKGPGFGFSDDSTLPVQIDDTIGKMDCAMYLYD
ncbi:hypothetical protein K439DRAFT_1646990 [Ramaria rubella]|nr:hypothetical protein K439DRAFT_1646990 [Ramaria rubella]